MVWYQRVEKIFRLMDEDDKDNDAKAIAAEPKTSGSDGEVSESAAKKSTEKDALPPSNEIAKKSNQKEVPIEEREITFEQFKKGAMKDPSIVKVRCYFTLIVTHTPAHILPLQALSLYDGLV